MRFWPRKKRDDNRITVRVGDVRPGEAIDLTRLAATVRHQQSLARLNSVAGIHTHPISATYYVDGVAVSSWAEVRGSLMDGVTHHVSMIFGEPGPELIVPTTPEETP